MPESGMPSSNDFSGTADNVAQVHALYGNLVFGDSVDSTRQAREFEDRYRSGVVESLDRVAQFGLGPGWATRFRLSAAYVDLSLTDSAASRSGLGVDDVLARRRRVLLEGSAGTGKPTVLRKLAIRALQGELPEAVAGTESPIPFVLKLRTFVHDDRLVLPEPEEFVAAVARPLGAAKPGMWVSRLLASGRALVLVDGIDEVRDVHRDQVLTWIRSLVDFYPDVSYVLTARPAAVLEVWRQELRGLGFTTARLEPMSRGQVDHFIDRWHQASVVPGSLAEALKRAVATSHDLSGIATSPLLCGVLCAIYVFHGGNLPTTRRELYETGLRLLLERRDVARGLRAHFWQLPQLVSRPLLGRIALWMMLNGQDSIPWHTAQTTIEEGLRQLPNDSPHAQSPSVLLHNLEEQTGILLSSGEGNLEFALPSFQDYFAAQEVIRQDLVKHLTLNAHSATYRDVILMTAELADEPVANRLLTGLAERAEAEPGYRRGFWLLAAACLAVVRELSPQLRSRIRAEALRQLPPSSFDDAHRLADAGAYVLELLIELATTREFTDDEATASIRAASMIDRVRAQVLVEHFGRRTNPQVQRELAAARARA